MSGQNVGCSIEKYPDGHHDTYSKTVFGFWLYLITDFVLFATMFAAYAVLNKSFFGGPEPKELFNLSYTCVQSYVMLFAAVCAGFGGAMVHRRHAKGAIFFFILTFILGLVFSIMQMKEVVDLVRIGHSWQVSAYLSIFFSIILTYFAHVVIALLWTIVLIVPVFVYGIDAFSMRRLTCLRMFWQFLNIVWVFIFTIIYLLGVI